MNWKIYLQESAGESGRSRWDVPDKMDYNDVRLIQFLDTNGKVLKGFEAAVELNDKTAVRNSNGFKMKNIVPVKLIRFVPVSELEQYEGISSVFDKIINEFKKSPNAAKSSDEIRGFKFPYQALKSKGRVKLFQ